MAWFCNKLSGIHTTRSTAKCVDYANYVVHEHQFLLLAVCRWTQKSIGIGAFSTFSKSTLGEDIVARKLCVKN